MSGPTAYVEDAERADVAVGVRPSGRQHRGFEELQAQFSFRARGELAGVVASAQFKEQPFERITEHF
jgi:hypothetical protein